VGKKIKDKPRVKAEPSRKEAMIDERVLAVAMAAMACAKHDARMVLFGVHMNGAVVQATDGKLLLQAKIETPEMLPADMPDVIVPIRRLVNGAKVTATPVPTGQQVEMEEQDGTRTTFHAIAGRFPDTSMVIPKGYPGAVKFTLNPHILKRLCNAAIKAGACEITIQPPPDQCKPVLFAINDVSSRIQRKPLVTGLMMPIKIRDDDERED